MKRILLAVIVIITFTFVGCSKNDVVENTPTENVQNVQKAIDAIFDKASATSIVINGELTKDDWELLKDIRNYLPIVENITLNDAIVIKSDVFSFIDWLKSFSAPNATEIENSSFSQCKSLTNIDIPQVEIIGNDAFSWCDQVTSFNFPKVKQVGKSAFYQCEKLTNIALPELTELKDLVFAFCELLISVDFPKVTKIGDNVFLSCTNLKAITFGATTNIEVTPLSFNFYDTKSITLDIVGINVDDVVGKIWKGYTWYNITSSGQSLPDPDFGIANFGSTMEYVKRYETKNSVSGGNSKKLIYADDSNNLYIYKFDENGKFISGELDKSVQFGGTSTDLIFAPIFDYKFHLTNLIEKYGDPISITDDVFAYNITDKTFESGYAWYEAQIIMNGLKEITYEFSNERCVVSSTLGFYTRTGQYQTWGYTITTTYSKR